MNTLDAYIQSLLHFVGQHPALAVLVVFIAAFSEAVPVIGAVVPGSAIIVGVSALIGLGHLAFWPILIGAVLGGIMGDGLSYWFGHHYKAQALSMWPLSRHPALISTSENFFLRHGGKSIAIARFTPVIRAFVPLIAGIAGMSATRFYLFNVVSALAWAPIHVLPGAAIGASLGILGGISGRVLTLVAIVVIAIILLMWLIRLFWQKLMVLLENRQQWLFSRLAHKDGRLVSILRDAIDPERSAARNVAILVAVLAAVVLVFSNLVADVVAQGEMARADNAVANLVTQLRTVWSDRVLVFVTTLADTPVTAAVALVTAIWLWCIGQRPLAFGLIALVTVTTLFALGLKATAHIPRPSAMYAGAVEFSFPSGHATFVTAIYGVLGWIAARDLARPWRTIVVGLVVGLIVIVAISRVYLGAHWPSDVMAGLLFGIGATVVFALAFRSASLTSRERLSMAGVAMVTLVAVSGWHLSSSYATALQRYAPVEHVTQLTAAQWRASEWMKVPAWRVDLGGEEEEPLVLQWAGSTADLAAALAAGGWRAGKELKLSTFPTFLAGTTTPSELPVIPQLNAGYAPDLTLIRIKSGNERDVMRIWDSRIRIENGSPKALFVGSVVRERLDHPLRWSTVSRMVDPADIDIPGVLSSLPNAVVVKRSDPVSPSERAGERRTTVLASQ